MKIAFYILHPPPNYGNILLGSRFEESVIVGCPENALTNGPCLSVGLKSGKYSGFRPDALMQPVREHRFVYLERTCKNRRFDNL